VSHAVELMVAHVENLRSRHEKNSVVLEEMKKQMEKSCRERHFCEQRGRRTPIRFSHDVKVVIHPLAFKKNNFFLCFTAEEIDSIVKLEKDPQKVLNANLFSFILIKCFLLFAFLVCICSSGVY